MPCLICFVNSILNINMNYFRKKIPGPAACCAAAGRWKRNNGGGASGVRLASPLAEACTASCRDEFAGVLRIEKIQKVCKVIEVALYKLVKYRLFELILGGG